MSTVKHTYMIQRHWVKQGWPLRFSDGERVIAVLDSVPDGVEPGEVHVTFLVELPAEGDRND